MNTYAGFFSNVKLKKKTKKFLNYFEKIYTEEVTYFYFCINNNYNKLKGFYIFLSSHL